MPSFGGSTPNQTVITHVPNDRFLANVPKHMSKSSSPNIHHSTKTLDKSQRKSSSVFNPYAKNRVSSSQPSSSTQNSINSHANNNIPENKKTLQGGSDVLGQVLTTEKKSRERRKQHEQNSMSKSALPKKRKYVHSYEQGFDGQVYAVPKPNKLFSKRGMPSSASSIPRPSAQKNATPIDNKESLIQRQKMIAQRIRFNRSKSENHNSAAGTVVPTSNRIAGSASATDSLDDFLSGGSSSLSQMNQFDKTKVFESKSKYDKEANAELFAKNRNVLNQLEKKESSYEKRNGRNGKNDNDKEKNIVMQWVCTTCKRTTGVRPSICICQNHVVKRRRELKKKLTLAEKRLKSVKNDGLILGAGLEWSSWRGYILNC